MYVYSYTRNLEISAFWECINEEDYQTKYIKWEKYEWVKKSALSF